MPPRRRPDCVVCQHRPSKYNCTSCKADYCSIACYQQHKETCTNISSTSSVQASESATSIHIEQLEDPTPLRPLTSLKWPYVPDTSAYPDPLTRDDPKPLQLNQYEAIATSSTIRTLLRSNPRLRDQLTSINAFRGAERERALERALGIDGKLRNADTFQPVDEDTASFRAFAEAVEAAVRGGREDALGLDWD